MTVKKISPANLIWDEHDQPRSKEFEDLYFSAENGLEESRYVFLQGNDLEQRWASLDEDRSFVICETGFGSGLNVLAAADLWNKTASKNARLHFISTELYPMAKKDLERTLAHWPELSDLAVKLINNYPALTPGFHRFELTSQISVTLIFDEMISGLSSLCPTLATELWDYQNWAVDAWFLDGFAPSINPEMWSKQIFPLINRLSNNNTSLATFTCAGMVKRGLREWGFDIEKIPGYGRKREMLTARYNQYLNVDLEPQKQNYRLMSPCWHLDSVQIKKPETVAIIGAGIAGCSTAQALARRGIKCTIIDTGADIACGASGNPQAALYARLSPDTGDLEDFCLHTLNFARGYYADKLINNKLTNRELNTDGLGNLTGLIQLPKSKKEFAGMQKIAGRFSDAPELVNFLNSKELNQKAGIEITSNESDGGLFFPSIGWINGQSFNKYLFERSPQARFIPNTTVTSMQENYGQFTIKSNGETIGTYDSVVLCTAMGSLVKSLFHEPANWLPIKPIRGQITLLNEQAEIKNLKTVLCRENYLTPMYQGKQSVGSTYELNTDSSELKAEDHRTNLNKLQKLLGNETPLSVDIEKLEGRAGTRTTTPDYLPIVGTLPSSKEFEAQYSDWKKDRKRPIPAAHASHSGIYLNLGYGSRGYVYAPLCAEILAAKIVREPEPVSIEMQRTLHPARFLVRSLSRNKSLMDTQ